MLWIILNKFTDVKLIKKSNLWSRRVETVEFLKIKVG